MNKTVSAILFAMPLAFCTGCGEEVSASSTENAFLRGADGVGAVLAVAYDTVHVERESITFDLRTEEEGNYGSAVAEYELANRGQEDVDLTMLLPFGRAPEYGRRADAYTVTVNGEEVGCRLRHSFAGSEEFSLNDVKRLSDDMRADAFYAPELPVTEYVFQIEIPEEGNIGGFEVLYHCNPNKTQIAFSAPVRTGVKNGWAKAYIPLPAGTHTLSMYAFGEPLGKHLVDLYQEGKGMAGRTECISETENGYSFVEFAMRDYTANEICATDYYNAYLDMLNACAGDYAMSASPTLFGRESCMAWYEYSITVPAGGTVKNVITTPLYPSVSSKNGGYRYDYEYQISLLHCFGECERLDINILTEDKLTSPSFPFEKTENGYSYTCDFLPQGELAFVVTDFDPPAEYKAYGEITPALTTGLVMLGVVAVGAVAVITIGIVRYKRGQREKLPQNGRTEEGKVDLGDGDNK